MAANGNKIDTCRAVIVTLQSNGSAIMCFFIFHNRFLFTDGFFPWCCFSLIERFRRNFLQIIFYTKIGVGASDGPCGAGMLKLFAKQTEAKKVGY